MVLRAQNAVRRADAIPLVMRLLCRSDDDDARAYALAALSSITAYHEENQTAAAKAGALSCLASLLVKVAKTPCSMWDHVLPEQIALCTFFLVVNHQSNQLALRRAGIISVLGAISTAAHIHAKESHVSRAALAAQKVLDSMRFRETPRRLQLEDRRTVAKRTNTRITPSIEEV